MNERFDVLLEQGNKIQELVIGFLESSYGYTFVAGDRNGITISSDYIEEICRCEYVAPTDRSGPRLRFQSEKGCVDFVMPDELLILKNTGQHRWFEVKNRTKNTLWESFKKLDDYKNICLKTGIDVFLTVVIWENKGYNIYVSKVETILNSSDTLNEYSKVFFDLSKFKRINKYPLTTQENPFE